MVICLERGADLHTVQLIPLPLTVSCFSKIQIGFTFLVPAHSGSPEQRAVKRVSLSLSGYWRNKRDITKACMYWAASSNKHFSFNVNQRNPQCNLYQPASLIIQPNSSHSATEVGFKIRSSTELHFFKRYTQFMGYLQCFHSGMNYIAI